MQSRTRKINKKSNKTNDKKIKRITFSKKENKKYAHLLDEITNFEDTTIQIIITDNEEDSEIKKNEEESEIKNINDSIIKKESEIISKLKNSEECNFIEIEDSDNEQENENDFIYFFKKNGESVAFRKYTNNPTFMKEEDLNKEEIQKMIKDTGLNLNESFDEPEKPYIDLNYDDDEDSTDSMIKKYEKEKLNTLKDLYELIINKKI